MKQNFIITVLAGLLFSFTFACGKGDVTDGGEGRDRPSFVKTYPGQNRVKLTWQLPEDPQITGSRIYWNGGYDSLQVSSAPEAEKDSVIIEDLPEGIYTFGVALIYSDRMASEPVQARGEVYGGEYAASLRNRTVETIRYFDVQQLLEIEWEFAGSGAVETEIKYTDGSGDLHSLVVPSSHDGITILENYDPGEDSTFVYRTGFLPESTAIDTFYTAYDSVKIIQEEEEPQIVWEGDAESGPDVFGQFNLDGDAEVTRVNDPEHGLVWKFHKPEGSNRCESSHLPDNLHAQEGDIWYIGWRFKVDMPLNTSTNAVFQWKSYPAAQQNFPVVLKHIDGEFTLLYQNPDYESEYPWEVPTEINSWISIVLKMRISRDEDFGYIELWYNGEQQIFDNGSARFYARTLDDGHNYPKWGVYGASDTDITNYVDALRIATTYELANPDER